LLFNARYYARQARCAEDRALEDFRSAGYRGFVDPHPLFDVRFFVQCHKVTDRSADPFETLGDLAAKTGRCPVTTPFFNSDWYEASNPDVVQAGVDPFRHYLESGAREGRRAHPWYKLPPFEGAPEDFFGKLDSLDAWIERSDLARIVTSEWIRGFSGLAATGSHSAFWRAKSAGTPMCPISLESVLGPLASAAGGRETLLREALHGLVEGGTA
jgi:hypothetical protein